MSDARLRSAERSDPARLPMERLRAGKCPRCGEREAHEGFPPCDLKVDPPECCCRGCYGSALSPDKVAAVGPGRQWIKLCPTCPFAGAPL